MKTVLAILAFFTLVAPATAALKGEMVTYRDGAATLEGYVVYDDAVAGQRPGVVVVHDWMGMGPFPKAKADALARLGYIAFAADIYGKGVRAKDSSEAAKLATIYKSDRPLMRSRVTAAFDRLVAHPLADRNRLGAMGYCFGGTVVLELARSGAPVVGVVSFHGGLDTSTPASRGTINSRVLVLHGADDPLVPPEQVKAFQDEMRRAGVDWQMVYYGGAVHSFTNPAAGNDPSKGVAYNAKADARSWRAMKDFFGETFTKVP